MRHFSIRAITIVLAVGFATGTYITARKQGSLEQAATAQQSSKPNALSSQPGSVANERLRDKVYDPDCRKPKDHDEADLCIQRAAVRTSEKTVWWAAFQSYVAIAGLAGVVTSLILAGWAAHESRKSAFASRESADFARRTFTELQRPWMFLSLDEVKRGKDEAGNFYSVAFTYKNHGGSPAIIKRHGVAMLLVTEEPDPASVIGAEIRWDRVVASGGSTETFAEGARRLQKPTMTAIQEGRVDLCFFGFIDYNGVNGVGGRTEFSLVYDLRTKWFLPRGEKHNRYT